MSSCSNSKLRTRLGWASAAFNPNPSPQRHRGTEKTKGTKGTKAYQAEISVFCDPLVFLCVLCASVVQSFFCVQLSCPRSPQGPAPLPWTSQMAGGERVQLN